MGASKARTQTEEQTLFPRWYETLEMAMKLPTNQEMRPDVNVLVFDEDVEFAWTSSDYLGRFVVPSKTIQAKFQSEPQWFNVMVGDGDEVEEEGQVLCSFQLIRKAEEKRLREKGDWGPPAPHGIKPPLEPCILEIFVIGIRNMEPFNFLEVSNPIVEVDGGDADTLMRSERGQGPDHSYLQLLKMQIDLPDDPLYAPTVNVRIIDERPLGEVNVGNGSIPIAPFMKWVPRSKAVKVPVVQVKEATGFEEIKDEDANEEVEEDHLVDYYPLDYDELNEMVDEEFKAYTFENRVKGGKAAGGGGKRTLKNVEKTAVDCDDDDDNDDGPAKPKAREVLPGQWELSKKDSIDWNHANKDNRGGFDKDTTTPFDEYPLKRGQKRGSTGLFGGANEQIVGKIKVQCRAYKEGSAAAMLSNLEERHKSLGRDQRMHLRLYVIQGLNLMSQDDNGFSDPFLNVELTNHPKIFDKDRTLRLESLQPLFYVMYEFRDCNMPGDHTLTIEVWDQDMIGDDLIGRASIDIENRWYCSKWWDHPEEFIAKRPKELVPLWSPMSGVPQGRLEVWIDTLTDAQDSEVAMEKLVMPKGEPWEFRVICWSVKDIILRDKSSVDMFVTGTLEYKDVQDNKMRKVPRADTDTHWFIDAGDPGVFHWRWVIPCAIPCKEPRLLVQTWDLDLLSPNDSLAEANLALSGFFKKADSSTNRQKAELDVSMTHPNYAGIQSTVKLSLDVLPMDEARQQPAIEGREGDAFLMDGFKRPPGVFSNMLASIQGEFYGQLKAKAMMGCGCLIVCMVVLILLFVAYQKVMK